MIYTSIDLINETQSLLETAQCSLVLPDDYKLQAAEYAIEGLKNDDLTADIDLYCAIERQDWNEVNEIYQRVFRPHLELFAKNSILKALVKQVA